MDELARTVDEYASNPDAYVEKYRSISVAAQYGDAFFDALAGDRVLDVGCGPGADLETMAAAGYDVSGLDITPAFLRAASDHVPDASLIRGDMRRLPVRTATRSDGRQLGLGPRRGRRPSVSEVSKRDSARVRAIEK